MGSETIVALIDRLKRTPLGVAYFAACILVPVIQTTFIFAQAMPISLCLLAVAGAFEARSAPLADWISSTMTWPAVALAVFAVWAAASSLWAPFPLESLVKSGGFVLVIGLVICGVQLGRLFGGPSYAHVTGGLAIGVAGALLYVAFETATEQWITRTLLAAFPSLQARFLGKHISVVAGSVVYVADGFLNRPTGVATLLLAPGWLLARASGSPAVKRSFCAVSALFVVVVLARSRHQSSQLALLAGIGCTLVALWSRKFATALLLVAWSVAVLASPIIVAALHAREVHKAEWLFTSAKARIVIWHATVIKILESPVIGVGAAGVEQTVRPAVRRAKGDIVIKPPFNPDEPLQARHSHNVYLQTWAELGLIGAALLLVAGLTFINALSKSARPADQAFVLGAFAAIAAMLFVSYGLWQLWFVASIGVAAILLSVGKANR